MHRHQRPEAAGLYDPSYEHDNCGVGAVACLTGNASHSTVQRALDVLDALEHRGASGAEIDTGDGAGILLQTPHDLLTEVTDFELPPKGQYAAGMVFLPKEPGTRQAIETLIEQTIEQQGQTLLGWRDVPVNHDIPGASAAAVEPTIRQVFIQASPDHQHDQDAFERKLYVIRRQIEKQRGKDIAIPSFSSRTIVYKGMLTSPQLREYYPDLSDPRCTSQLALVHSRFSTNTFPSWELAHPYRYIAHNGEINTLRGNINWMRARESRLLSDAFPGDELAQVIPVVDEDGSDSAIFDNVLELLVLAGRSLPHALMMMIPEAWEGRDDMPDHLRDFYAYHSCLMEPWDGPAAVAFTDGRVIGATLDRNGLRPGRWQVTNDDFVVLASETGVLEYPADEVKAKGRLQPGKLFFVDVENGRIVDDDEVKYEIATQQPYGQWYRDRTVHLDDMPDVAPRDFPSDPLIARQQMFGYTQEDLRISLASMGGAKAEEPTGSMGNDFALAVLSDRQPPLYSYFKQLFAQVTNPPIDPIREKVVMSLSTGVGPQENLLTESPEHAHQLVISQPLLSNGELEKLRQVDHDVYEADTLDATFPAAEGAQGLEKAMERLCREASELIESGDNILIVSDRRASRERVPIPALLAVAGVHHHLVREGTRLQTGLVVESGEPREPHHIACLLGYGASAVNPYLAFETLRDMFGSGHLPGVESAAQAETNMVKAVGKAILKTISKMGISTVRSYSGAQIFEAVGLEKELVDRYFTHTTSRIGGIGLEVLAAEALERHQRAFPRSDERLPIGGVHQWRRDGERHQWNPDTVASVQHAVRAGGAASYEEFTRMVNDESKRRATLRGLLKLKPPPSGPIPIEEVESAKDIVKRFATGAMSLGSLSAEAHETLAIAMNRLGGKSNTGEGGEDPRRFTKDPNGDNRRSAIKQVASGRFGVTAHYLVNADELQIKMAQGAKPGEGGQLPGHKVDQYIAKIRNSTPGVGLISPPPHHDIYSIEDLKQLIFDLRCANPKARISVKLVSEVGVGTVAAGVAKANSDHVVIAGHDGGTGASPVSSIQSAGVPWEIGLAETQQTLVMNKLRDRIVVQTDGQLKTGRDVVVAALLGAEEFGFSTAPLITLGCIMMRACHLNTCPVGIATQDPELRKRFRGKPEHVVNYFFFIAEEVRNHMAALGVRRFEDLVGRTDLLQADAAIEHWKARGVDLSNLLAPPDAPADVPRRRVRPQDPVLDTHRDHELIEQAGPALERGEKVSLQMKVRNRHRTVGGLLSGEVARRYGAEGLPEETIVVDLEGSGGQSFGAWLAPGVTFSLTGDANDFVGKGLSGGVLSVRPPENVTFVPEKNVVIGNTVLYGATAGRAFFRGLAGERFAVRNSGVDAVVEGVGDHGCEYMTGGRVVVLGPTGRNFAAGMSGGIAYVLDPEGRFPARCNTELVELEGMEDADLDKVRALVQEHAQRTGSTVAAGVLERWDELARAGAWVKVMPMDYKRALREEAERRSEEAGEPAVIGERGNGDGSGPVEAGQGAPYAPAGGNQEASRPGEAGQYEDAAVAAGDVGRATRARGADNGTEEQAEAEAAEEVLPSNG
jgi:glutamate synthase domain-containing protein 2/glutamate synthase domain-containing protein 1/glutamate synthase domain-containing protein 3